MHSIVGDDLIKTASQNDKESLKKIFYTVVHCDETKIKESVKKMVERLKPEVFLNING